MFRDMRRKNQVLTPDESAGILRRGTSGVLAVPGDGGYPYAVPLSYVYEDGRIYFHCAKSGHKLDAIAKDDKVSFCVIDQDRVVPEEYTTYFRSVIAFGTARVLTDEAEKRTALVALTAKYSPDDEQGRLREIGAQLAHVAMVEMTIEHLTGKEAVELAKGRERG